MSPLTESDQVLLSHLRDLSRRAYEGGYITVSDFLDERQLGLLSSMEGRLSVSMAPEGVFEEAERQAVFFVPPEMKPYLKESIDDALCCLKIELQDRRFLSRPPEHRDYLGALMGLGIKREKLGDIRLQGMDAYLVCKREIAPYIIESLTSVGRSLVMISYAQQEEYPEPPKGIESVISVASLRLDALVARGFNLSRDDAQKAIRQGLVFIDGQESLEPDRMLEIGKRITFRSKGRLILRESKGSSRSGREQIRVEFFGLQHKK